MENNNLVLKEKAVQTIITEAIFQLSVDSENLATRLLLRKAEAMEFPQRILYMGTKRKTVFPTALFLPGWI